MNQQGGVGQSDSDLASEGGLNTGKMAPACRLHGRRATQGRWGLYLQSLPQIYTTQSLPICLWCTQSDRPSSGAQGEYLRRPFKGTLGFLAALCPTQAVKIPTAFHSQKLWGFFFSASVLGAGEPGVGAGVPRYFMGNLWPRCEYGNSSFLVSAPPTRLDKVSRLLYILIIKLNYKTSVQRDFRWFSGLIFL